MPNTPGRLQFFGFYARADQEEPTYDPGRSVPCLFCAKPWDADTVRTISMYVPAEIFTRPDGEVKVRHAESARSFFYRVHRACDDALTHEEKSLYEGPILFPPSTQS
jgi:hypothetical protein